jgi:hypothetical protein
MIDPETFREFEAWFNREVEHSDFAGETAQSVLDWAEKNGFLDEVLTLCKTDGHLSQLDSSLTSHSAEFGTFPSVRRVGGDHDRGFSPALNREMRRRAPSDE